MLCTSLWQYVTTCDNIFKRILSQIKEWQRPVGELSYRYVTIYIDDNVNWQYIYVTIYDKLWRHVRIVSQSATQIGDE